MLAIETELPGVYILEPKIFCDERGWFMETWSLVKMSELDSQFCFVQDNHSYSAKKGTLRGIHFQNGMAAQAKLVRCIKGRLLDVAVDLRKASPAYKKWIAVELSAENKRQLLIPRGFGHGFLTLTDDVEFLYKVDNPYNATADRGIRWNDPELAINWGITVPFVSEKDAVAPLLRDSDCNFT